MDDEERGRGVHVDRGGWNVLIITSAISFVVLVALAVLFDHSMMMYAVIPSILLPIIASSLYLNIPESLGRPRRGGCWENPLRSSGV